MSGAVTQKLLARAMMRGGTKEQTLRRRDAASAEMELLARVMNDPKPDPTEVTDYIGKLAKMQHIPNEYAAKVIASVPRDPEALRAWAKNMFAFVMHQGIHGHAAYPREIYPPQVQPQEPQAPAPTTNGTPTIQ